MNSALDWSWVFSVDGWFRVGFLTLMEVVLGVDNVVMISILSSKLPKEQRSSARRMGLAVALITRILLLLSIAWVMSLTKPLFTVLGWEATGRGLILLFGGLFLIAKPTLEMFEIVERPHEHGGDGPSGGGRASWLSIVLQIGIVDIVFSLDSVITAVGLVGHVSMMIAAVLVAIGFMMVLANPVADFIDEHPSVKMLALSFLILIGTLLVAEAFHQEFDRGYVYAAMAFSFFVELLNLRRHDNMKKHEAAMAARAVVQGEIGEALDDKDDRSAGS